MKIHDPESRTRPTMVLSLIVAILHMSACQDFFGTEDLKQQIKDDVTDATAAVVDVYIASSSMGTLSPVGPQSWKVGVEYTITATPGTSYGFIGWSADAGAITFADASSAETTVTVNAAYSGTITITPEFDSRPRVKSIDPADGNAGVPINKTITIYFSEEVDTSSLVLGDTIQITTASSQAAVGTEEVSIDDYFNTPAVSGKWVTLALKDDVFFSKLFRVYVALSTGIRDLQGQTMAEDKYIYFTTGDGLDDSAPAINSFTVTNSVGATSTASSARAYTNGISLVLNVAAVDDQDNVTMIQVIETPCDSSGNATGDAVAHDVVTFDSTLAFALSTSSEGYTKIQIKVADSSPNWSTVSGNVYDTKIVMLDTTPPTSVAVTGDDSPYEPSAGDYWCGSSGVTFSLSCAESGSGLAGYTTDSDGSSPAPDLTPTLTSSGTLYAVDVAGNVSESGVSVTVHQDTTPPPTPTLSSYSCDYGPVSGVYWCDATGVVFHLASDDGSGSGTKGYSTNSSGTSPAASPITRTSGATFYAVDNVGNVSTSGLTLNVSQDTASPNAPSVTAASGSVYSSGSTYWYSTGSGVTFTFTSSDGTGSQIAGYYLDASGTTSATGALSAGAYNVYAIDNVDYASSPLQITVGRDNDKPGTPEIDGTPTVPGYGNAYTDGTYYWYGNSYSGVTFAFTSDDGVGAGVEGYYRNSAGTTAVSNPFAAGTYTIYAKDLMGLVSNQSLDLTVRQDTGLPNTPSVSSYAGYYYDGSKYWYSANDSDGVSFTLTGSDSSTNSSGFAGFLLAGASEGSSQTRTAGIYSYYSVDNAGNPSSSALSVTIAQDTDLPTVTGSLSSTDGTSISGFTVSDPSGGSGLDTSSYEVTLGGSAAGSFNGTVISGLTAPTSDGDTDYILTVGDRAGNEAFVTVRLTRSTDGEGEVTYTAEIVD